MRKPKFTVRALAGMVAIVAACLTWWVRSAHQQQVAVEIVERHGSVVYWHEQPADARRPDFTLKPPGPDWLREWMGNQYFQRVRTLRVSPDDDEMKHVVRLTSIDGLIIDVKNLSGVGVGLLRKFNQLKWIDLDRGYSLTTEDFSFLTHLKKLEQVQIEGAPIDASIVEYLRKLPNLDSVYFEATPITDDEAKAIAASLPNVRISSVGRYIGGPNLGEKDRLFEPNIKATEARQ